MLRYVYQLVCILYYFELENNRIQLEKGSESKHAIKTQNKRLQKT